MHETRWLARPNRPRPIRCGTLPRPGGQHPPPGSGPARPRLCAEGPPLRRGDNAPSHRSWIANYAASWTRIHSEDSNPSESARFVCATWRSVLATCHGMTRVFPYESRVVFRRADLPRPYGTLRRPDLVADVVRPGILPTSEPFSPPLARLTHGSRGYRGQESRGRYMTGHGRYSLSWMNRIRSAGKRARRCPWWRSRRSSPLPRHRSAGDDGPRRSRAPRSGSRR